MTLALQFITVRSPRRLRLKYTQALAAGAFSASWFAAACLDGSTADPGIVQALLVAGAADELELAVGADLAPGGQYQLTSAPGIPAADSTFTVDQDVTAFRLPLSKQAPSASVTSDDVRAIIFGEDLLHDGGDMVETPDGDLATLSGEENALESVARIALSDGLPYNSAYGAKLRPFVDAPIATAPSARGQLERSIRADTRVKRVSASVLPDDNSGDLTLQANVSLIGGSKHSLSRSI